VDERCFEVEVWFEEPQKQENFKKLKLEFQVLQLETWISSLFFCFCVCTCGGIQALPLTVVILVGS
jgi:hypothetical protein